MKKVISVFVIIAFLAACNESSINVEAEADSLNKKLENAGEKIEDKAEKVWDSTKEKATELKDKAEQKWDSAKVRNNNNDTTKKQ